MSLAPPEANGPLRRERLRTARLYFVCDARPGGEDPEALLRAALTGGVDIVQLREKELDRGGDRARRRRPSAASATPTAPSSSSTTTPTWPAPATPTASTSARTTPPVEAARELLGPDAIIGLSTHSEEQIAAAAERPVDYISVGPVWETPTKAGRPAVGLGADRPRGRARAPTRSSRSAASTPPTPSRSSRPGRGGSAWCGRSATPPIPAPSPERCARAFAGPGEAARAARVAEAPAQAQASAAPAPTARERMAARLRQGRGAKPGGARSAGAAGRGRAADGGHGRRRGRGPDRALDRRRLRRRGEGQRRDAERSPQVARPGAADGDRWPGACGAPATGPCSASS